MSYSNLQRNNTIGNFAGPTKDFTNVSSNLLVVFLDIISNFLRISCYKPLKLKN